MRDDNDPHPMHTPSVGPLPRRTKPSQESEIIHHASGGTTLAGPDAMNLYRAITVKQGISLYVKTEGRMTITSRAKGGGIKNLLAIAGEYSGKKYTIKQADIALVDIQKWIDTMKAALPTSTAE